MRNISKLTLCLLIGILIGNNLSFSVKDKVIETTNKSYYYNSQVEFYDNMIEDVNTMEVYDTSELTHEIMANRNGKIVVEKIIGEVVNQNLDGKILNASNKQENYLNKSDGLYMNYKRVDGAKRGDKILTYFIYNPFTNEQDDVLTRLDFIIDCNEI